MCEKSSYEGPTEIESHLYRGHRSRRSLFDYHFQNIQTKLKKTTPNVSPLVDKYKHWSKGNGIIWIIGADVKLTLCSGVSDWIFREQVFLYVKVNNCAWLF